MLSITASQISASTQVVSSLLQIARTMFLVSALLMRFTQREIPVTIWLVPVILLPAISLTGVIDT